MRPRLTPKEMDEKRAKGLCYWCPEKFTANHVCSRRRAFVMHMAGEGESEEEDEPVTEETEEPLNMEEIQLSLHAMWGTKAPQIMRIRGASHGKSLKVLVDTGSTHNFLSSRMAEKIQCETVEVPLTAVEVANGQVLKCNRKCVEFSWVMQGTRFATEVFIIGLETYDLIL